MTTFVENLLRNPKQKTSLTKEKESKTTNTTENNAKVCYDAHTTAETSMNSINMKDMVGKKKLPETKEKEINKDPENISIAQWNGRSMNPKGKELFLESMEVELIALQEIWRPKKDLKDKWEVTHQTQRTEQRGGGTATLTKKINHFQTENILKINKDCNLLKLKWRDN